jgi:hypothetical protein
MDNVATTVAYAVVVISRIGNDTVTIDWND